ncbi:MAG: M23 family metallopeptidase [Chloroflexi bacterium]|nr:M23 family metallopeptidase [Chloroflexota bacterium]
MSWTPLLHPAPTGRVSQWFGVNRSMYADYGLPGHEGVDVALPLGTPVRAMHSGIVDSVASGPTYGNQVWLKGEGLTSLYAHLTRATVRVGQTVMRGEKIGDSGDTGRATGPHLHVGLKIEGIKTAYKDWVDPALYWLTGVPRGSKLSYHVQKPDYPTWLRTQMDRSGAQILKVMDPAGLPPVEGRLYIGRLYWPVEPDKTWVQAGAAGADRWWHEAEMRIRRAPWVHIWEGPNEVAIQDMGQARTFGAFERRRIALLHSEGLWAASGVFSTGNPPLSLWPIWRETLAETDFLALHQYGMKTEKPQMGRQGLNLWHLYRHEKVIETLRENNCRVPPILITETGIDYGGDPQRDGWRAQDLSAETFMLQLAAFDAALPPEVLAATPFTWQPYGWPSFDMSGRISELFTDYLRERNSAGPIASPPIDLAQIAIANRWQQEEAIREIERGEHQAARRRLIENLTRAYVLEAKGKHG